MSSTWNNLPSGVLNDAAIRSAHESLFTAGYRDTSVKQCCYEFHVGDEVIDLSKSEQDRITPVADGDYFLIRPQCTVVVKVAEQIRLPKDCLARFLLKGKYFSVGIAPINTYADPGFSGYMGAVLTNTSNYYIRISRNDALLKAEFVKLPAAVDIGYEGQHGFHTGHWPILQQYRANEDHLKAKAVIPRSYDEILRSYGEPVAEAVARLRYYSWAVWIQLTVVTLALCLIIRSVDTIGGGWALALGIFGNLVATFFVAVARRSLPPKWRGDL